LSSIEELDELINRVASANSNDIRELFAKAGIDIKRDLSGENCENINLSALELRGANLKGTYLKNADLSNSDLQDADMARADLSGADLRSANLINANLKGANLTGAKLWGSKRLGCSLEGVRCDYVYFDKNGKSRSPKDRNFLGNEFKERETLGINPRAKISQIEKSSIPQFNIKLTPVKKILVESIKLINRSLKVPVAIWLQDHKTLSIIAQQAMDVPEAYFKNVQIKYGDNSLVSRVIATGEEQLIQDISKSSNFPRAEYLRASGITSVMASPIMLKGKSIGAFEFFNSDSKVLERLDREMVGSFSNLVGISLENAQKTQLLSKITKELGKADGLLPAMQYITDKARELTNAHSAVIVLLDKHTNRFLINCTSPQNLDDASTREPRVEGGLTRKIIDTGKTIFVSDLTRFTGAKADLIREGVRSAVGIQVRHEDTHLGALWVNGLEKNQFSDIDVQILEALAAQVSVALGWSVWFLEPTSEIEKVTSNLYRSDELFKQVCEEVEKKAGFDYAALQLIRPEERIIETVYGTASANKLSGMAKHSIDRPQVLLDIQSDVAKSYPPRIEIVGGWDPRFNRWIYDTYNHEKYSRVWLPILVVRDENGNVSTDWIENCKWIEVVNKKNADGWRIALELDLDSLGIGEDDPVIECIGTVDSGFENSREKIGIDKAIDVARIINRWALDMHKAQLPFVLETITNNAQKILQSDSATLHFLRNKEAFAYEKCSGSIDQACILSIRGDLKVIEDKVFANNEPYISPEISDARAVSSLKSKFPDLYKQGVKSIAAFPLKVVDNSEEKLGLLFIIFTREHLFTQDEITWMKTFARWAQDAIRHATYFMQLRDNAKQLSSLNEIARSLVKSPDSKENLLNKIAGNALNILAADVVSIYEYIEERDCFPSPPHVVGRLVEEDMITEPPDKNSPPMQLVKSHDDIFIEDTHNYDEQHRKKLILSTLDGKNRKGEKNFVIRERVKSVACTLLQVAGETVGVMFVNYRTPRVFSANEKQTHKILSSAAAVGIKTKRTYERVYKDLKRRTAEVEALKEANKAIVANVPNLPSVLSLILDRALQITRSQHGSIMQYDKWKGKLFVKAQKGFPQNYLDHKLELGEGVVGLAAKEMKPFIVNDVLSDEWMGIYKQVVSDTRSELVVPLIDEDKLWGVLNVEHSEVNAFSNNDIVMLETLALQAIIAVHSAELYHKRVNPMRALSRIAAQVQVNHEIQTVVRMLLTGVTSGEGLGFSRAMIFLCDKNNQFIKGEFALGASTRKEADDIWRYLDKKSVEVISKKEDLLSWLLQQDQNQSVKEKNSLSPLSEAIRAIEIPISQSDCALIRCLKEKSAVKVEFDQPDYFREKLNEFTGVESTGYSFVCVPLVNKLKEIGVLVVDNRFLLNERDGDMDLISLSTFASVAAMSIDNAWLAKNRKESERMATWKRLNTKVAHVIGTRIASLRGIESIISTILEEDVRLDKDHEIYSHLGALRQDLTDANKSLQELRDDYVPKYQEFIEIQKFLKRLFEEVQFDITFSVPPNFSEIPLFVFGDMNKLLDAFLELISNSKHALKDVPEENHRIKIKVDRKHNDDTVEIVVEDNGPGISGPDKEYIFTDTFTTKKNGGLGLGIVYDTIKQHQGRIVENGVPGEGARFVINLPIAEFR